MHVMDGNVTGIQEWVVPKNGVYMIEAWGAWSGSIGGRFGGLGTKMTLVYLNYLKAKNLKLRWGKKE